MSRIGRTSRWALAGSGVLLGAVILLGIVPWRLVAAETKRATYMASVAVRETQKNGAKKVLAEPNLMYVAGSSVTVEIARGASALRIDVSSPLGKQPIEHTIETKMIRYRDFQALVESQKEEASTAYRDPKEGDRALQRLSEKEKEDMFRRNKAIAEAREKNAVVLRCPKLFVRDGKLGRIAIPDGEGCELEIEVTVSPYEEPENTAPKTEGHSHPSQILGKANLNLADYEAIPSPKHPDLGPRPYRMDAGSYGIVVSNDAQGEARIAGVNKRTGQWKWLELPKSNRILFEPIMGDDVTAFLQHGEPISHLVVYNGRLNQWSSFPLQNRVMDVVPYVGDRMVCYHLSDRVVAYSAPRDAWGMLLTQATPAVGDEAVSVETVSGRYEFPGANGAWAAVKPPTTKSR